MSEEWVETCKKFLNQIKEISDKKDKDRLDLVSSMRFSLYALHRSILGWVNWVNNPGIMASFKREELDGMNRRLTEFIGEFINYDIEVTKKGTSKNIAPRKARQEVKEKAIGGPDDIFYI